MPSAKNDDPTLQDFLQRINPVRQEIKQIVLFGSCARGDSAFDSDYDLLCACGPNDRHEGHFYHRLGEIDYGQALWLGPSYPHRGRKLPVQNMIPTCSTTAALVVGDVLAMALMKLRNFQPDDFAANHPGGNLGNVLTVGDIMGAGNKNPVIHVSADARWKLSALASLAGSSPTRLKH